MARSHNGLSNLFILWLAASGCSGRHAQPTTDTPERQFVFEDVSIEQRRGGEASWTTTARRAEGDLTKTDAEAVHMVGHSNKGHAETYDIQSPRASLAFDAGSAVFEEVHIEDSGGGRLEAGTARYERDKERIFIAGPVAFSAQHLLAHAPSAEIHLDESTMIINGPVEGRFDPTPRAPAPRQP